MFSVKFYLKTERKKNIKSTLLTKILLFLSRFTLPCVSYYCLLLLMLLNYDINIRNTLTLVFIKACVMRSIFRS